MCRSNAITMACACVRSPSIGAGFLVLLIQRRSPGASSFLRRKAAVLARSLWTRLSACRSCVRLCLNGWEKPTRSRPTRRRVEVDYPATSTGSRLFENQNRRCNHRGPQAALIAYAALGNVGGADDLVGDAVNLLFFIPGLVRVEFHVERGGKHLCSQFFRVF